MKADQSSSPRHEGAAVRWPHYKDAIRPHVGPWMEVREAYRNLSSQDYDARIEARRLLRSLGKESESLLIALLHHSDEGVREFAASELAHKAQLTNHVIEAFLLALESRHHISEIGHPAATLFYRYATNATGPLTETDRRMIAWLKRELSSVNPDESGTAAWALTAFMNRDSTLKEPLFAYLKNGAFFYKSVVLREMADSDPSLYDAYVEVLLSGLGSSVYSDQMNALHGLTKLKSEPGDLRSRLESLRKESSDPGAISRIEKVLTELNKNAAEQP